MNCLRDFSARSLAGNITKIVWKYFSKKIQKRTLNSKYVNKGSFCNLKIYIYAQSFGSTNLWCFIAKQTKHISRSFDIFTKNVCLPRLWQIYNNTYKISWPCKHIKVLFLATPLHNLIFFFFCKVYKINPQKNRGATV